MKSSGGQIQGASSQNQRNKDNHLGGSQLQFQEIYDDSLQESDQLKQSQQKSEAFVEVAGEGIIGNIKQKREQNFGDLAMMSSTNFKDEYLNAGESSVGRVSQSPVSSTSWANQRLNLVGHLLNKQSSDEDLEGQDDHDNAILPDSVGSDSHEDLRDDHENSSDDEEEQDCYQLDVDEDEDDLGSSPQTPCSKQQKKHQSSSQQQYDKSTPGDDKLNKNVVMHKKASKGFKKQQPYKTEDRKRSAVVQDQSNDGSMVAEQKTDNCNGTDMVKVESDMPSSVAAADASCCPFSRNQSPMMVQVTESAVILSNLDHQKQQHHKQKLGASKDSNKLAAAGESFEIQHDKVLQKQNAFKAMDITEQISCLQEQFAKMYLYLRQRIKSSQRVSYDNILNGSLLQSEDRLVFKMDTFLVIEYIKTAINVVLDIKFEEIEQKLAENSTKNNHNDQNQYHQYRHGSRGDDSSSISSTSELCPEVMLKNQTNIPGDQHKKMMKNKQRQVSDPNSNYSAQKHAIFSPKMQQHNHMSQKHGKSNEGEDDDEVKQVRTERGNKPVDMQHQSQQNARTCKQPSSSMDTTDAVPSCPEMYEKLIQDLEADVRKHIRIQQQLKLHIESVEDRVEELEMENEQILAEFQRQGKKFKRQVAEFEKAIKKLKEDKQKHKDEAKTFKETNSKLREESKELNEELNRLKANMQGMQAQNFQESSFTLNRSIDQGEQFLTSLKKHEYSQFLKSTKVFNTTTNNQTHSSCNSRSGKFAAQHQQMQQQQQQQTSYTLQQQQYPLPNTTQSTKNNNHRTTKLTTIVSNKNKANFIDTAEEEKDNNGYSPESKIVHSSLGAHGGGVSKAVVKKVATSAGSGSNVVNGSSRPHSNRGATSSSNGPHLGVSSNSKGVPMTTSGTATIIGGDNKSMIPRQDFHKKAKLNSSMNQAIGGNNGNNGNNKDEYQMQVMLTSTSNGTQQIINSNTSKVQLSPRSIGKLHQNLHSQQAYGRKSPLVSGSAALPNNNQNNNVLKAKDDNKGAAISKAQNLSQLNGSQDSSGIVNTSGTHGHTQVNRFNSLQALQQHQTAHTASSDRNSLTRGELNTAAGHNKNGGKAPSASGSLGGSGLAANTAASGTQKKKGTGGASMKQQKTTSVGSSSFHHHQNVVLQNQHAHQQNQSSVVIQNSWVNSTSANHTQRELIATSKKNNHSIASINSAGQSSLQNSSQLYTTKQQMQIQANLNNSVVTQVNRQLSTKKVTSSNGVAKREPPLTTQKQKQSQLHNSQHHQHQQMQLQQFQLQHSQQQNYSSTSNSLHNQQHMMPINTTGIQSNSNNSQGQQTNNNLIQNNTQANASNQNAPGATTSGNNGALPHNLAGMNFAAAAASAANPANAAVMVNVGNLGYPSIINNNIQGLSINYSNHIIQQAAPQPGATQDQSSFPTTSFTATANTQTTPYLSRNTNANQGNGNSRDQAQTLNLNTNLDITNLKDQGPSAESQGHHPSGNNHLPTTNTNDQNSIAAQQTANGNQAQPTQQCQQNQSSALSSHRRCRSQSPRGALISAQHHTAHVQHQHQSQDEQQNNANASTSQQCCDSHHLNPHHPRQVAHQVLQNHNQKNHKHHHQHHRKNRNTGIVTASASTGVQASNANVNNSMICHDNKKISFVQYESQQSVATKRPKQFSKKQQVQHQNIICHKNVGSSSRQHTAANSTSAAGGVGAIMYQQKSERHQAGLTSSSFQKVAQIVPGSGRQTTASNQSNSNRSNLLNLFGAGQRNNFMNITGVNTAATGPSALVDSKNSTMGSQQLMIMNQTTSSDAVTTAALVAKQFSTNRKQPGPITNNSKTSQKNSNKKRHQQQYNIVDHSSQQLLLHQQQMQQSQQQNTTAAQLIQKIMFTNAAAINANSTSNSVQAHKSRQASNGSHSQPLTNVVNKPSNKVKMQSSTAQSSSSKGDNAKNQQNSSIIAVSSTNGNSVATAAALLSQRSRNYKFKMGSGGGQGPAAGAGTQTVGAKLNNNSGINLLGHHSTAVGGATAGMNTALNTSVGANQQKNGYNTGSANFGLSAIGNLAGLVGSGGSYLTKGASVINTSGNIQSAYATNASDLIRGFKSSQSIPVVTSQQASIHRSSRDSSQGTVANQQNHHGQILPHKTVKSTSIKKLAAAAIHQGTSTNMSNGGTASSRQQSVSSNKASQNMKNNTGSSFKSSKKL